MVGAQILYTPLHEDTIAVSSREASSKMRGFLALPARLGDMGISIPTRRESDEHLTIASTTIDHPTTVVSSIINKHKTIMPTLKPSLSGQK